MKTDTFRVVNDPLQGGRWQVQKLYHDIGRWYDVGDACDTRAEADEKLKFRMRMGQRP